MKFKLPETKIISSICVGGTHGREKISSDKTGKVLF